MVYVTRRLGPRLIRAVGIVFVLHAVSEGRYFSPGEILLLLHPIIGVQGRRTVGLQLQ